MNVNGEVEGENISCPLSMSITYDFKVIISLTIDCELSSLIFGVPHDTSVVSNSSKKNSTHSVGNRSHYRHDSGIDLSITIDKLRVFINKTLSTLSVYQ